MNLSFTALSFKLTIHVEAIKKLPKRYQKLCASSKSVACSIVLIIKYKEKAIILFPCEKKCFLQNKTVDCKVYMVYLAILKVIDKR